MTALYPEIEPFHHDFMPVSDIHTIYYEQCGNPNGIPVLIIHGGPGGGIVPEYRQYFNPKHYHVILVDQRGCGKSTPHAELRENTTWDLVADFEKIRQHLNIDKWLLFGGSWGSTLSLAYGQAHPESATGMILRGVFLGRDQELDWLYKFGASEIFPDHWDKFVNAIPAAERDNFPEAYHKRLMSNNREEQLHAAKAWSIWEGSTSKLHYDPKLVEHFADEDFAIAIARIENHYFINKLFLTERPILDHLKSIAHLPIAIVQGRYDIVCPPGSAWLLHKSLPTSTIKIVPASGHSATEPGIRNELVSCADDFIKKLSS